MEGVSHLIEAILRRKRRSSGWEKLRALPACEISELRCRLTPKMAGQSSGQFPFHLPATSSILHCLLTKDFEEGNFVATLVSEGEKIPPGVTGLFYEPRRGN